MKMAFEYRMFFKSDVIIDLVGYRRWGHNELDEPGLFCFIIAFTQPTMYKEIRSKITTPKKYEQLLIVF